MIKDQTMLQLASQMNNELSNFTDKIPQIFKEAKLNLPVIEYRTNVIEYLSNILAVINEYSNRLTNILTQTKNIQSQDFLTLESTLKLESSEDTSKKNKSMIDIIDGVQVPAIQINSMKQLKKSGELYYIKSNKIFAVKINNIIYWGNVGNILKKKPSKVKECTKIDNHSYNSCKYYHPPTKFTGSQDTRNYMYNDWIHYSVDKFGNRPIGSKDSLCSDLKQINSDDLLKFDNQIMHDLICSLSAHSNFLEPT